VETLGSAVADAKKALEKQDDVAVTAALERLERESHRVAGVLYQQAAPDGGAPPPSGTRPAEKGEGVVDAEFEDTGTGST
jgi:molecular chaperone DnaK